MPYDMKKLMATSPALKRAAMRVVECLKKWAKQVLIACDQLGNALMGGWADETLSARAYRRGLESKRWRCVQTVIDAVFFWDRGTVGGEQMRHCQLSYNSELLRLQSPPEAR